MLLKHWPVFHTAIPTEGVKVFTASAKMDMRVAVAADVRLEEPLVAVGDLRAYLHEVVLPFRLAQNLLHRTWPVLAYLDDDVVLSFLTNTALDYWSHKTPLIVEGGRRDQSTAIGA